MSGSFQSGNNQQRIRRHDAGTQPGGWCGVAGFDVGVEQRQLTQAAVELHTDVSRCQTGRGPQQCGVERGGAQAAAEGKNFHGSYCEWAGGSGLAHCQTRVYTNVLLFERSYNFVSSNPNCCFPSTHPEKSPP
jgi:uncharacterized membrane protein